MSDLATLLALPYAENVYPSIYTDGRPCYVAEIPDLPGCVAYGDTTDEALVSLSQARKAYITHHHEHGLNVPPPCSQPSHRWQTTGSTDQATTITNDPAEPSMHHAFA